MNADAILFPILIILIAVGLWMSWFFWQKFQGR